ncbi:MAG: hypothetical protein KDA41_10375 [Planctomycetales bacterium]|nr:hypothetical protein [Planctomycetales bacterium]
MITQHVRESVARRAQTADSEKELGNIIFACLSDNGISWKSAGNEDVKQLLVDAVRAFRSAHGPTPPRVAV